MCQTILYSSAQVSGGMSFIFNSIVTVVVGGVLLTGGFGSVIGALFGALIFGMVQQGIFFTGVDTDWFQLFVGAMVLLAKLAPILLLPIFYRFKPLERDSLRARLVALSQRAGVPVLGVYEWGLGEKTVRANAALVGTGRTRRILVSDTLLQQYSDDEIEVILAHELAHHIHRDILKALVLETALLLTAFYAAAMAVDAWWRPLGLTSPADVGGLPLLLLTGGAVSLAATPALNAISRFNERRADRYALTITRQPSAFVSAMRRLGAQNLAEEHPSRASLWLFHTHPPLGDRIEAATRFAGVSERPARPSSGGSGHPA
jgi:STE24 endopeptidase